MVWADSDRITRVPPYSGYTQTLNSFWIRGVRPLCHFFPKISPINLEGKECPTTPVKQVWPVPLSLTTTEGIAFAFFSSRYWDVSLHEVRFQQLWIGCWMINLSKYHISTFGDLGISISYRLLLAYRRLARPS